MRARPAPVLAMPHPRARRWGEPGYTAEMWVLAPTLAAAAPPDLAGTWRVEWVAANRVKVPILGTTTVLTRQVSLARVAAVDGGFEQSHVACSIAAESDSSFTSTTFPPGFLRSLPTKRYPLQLVDTAEGWRLAADTGPLAIGFRAELASGLPTEVADPSVFDWDDDGAPGATVTVRAPLFGEVDVYVVQASRGLLDGRVVVQDGVATGVEGAFRLGDFAQHTIGASNRLFHTTPRATFVPEQSHLWMSRVADGATCADLVGG